MSQRTEEDSEEPDEYVHYLRLKRREQLIHYFQSQFPALPGCYHIGIQKLFKHEFDMCKASHEHRETWRRKLADFPNRMRIRKRMRDEGYKTKCIPWRALDGRIISYEIPEEMGVVRKRSTSASFNQTVRDDDEDTEEQVVTRTYNNDRYTETRRIPNPRSEGWSQFQWEMHERQQPRPATPYIPRQPTGTRETANRQTINSYFLNEIRECHIPRPLPAAHGPNNNSGFLQTPGAELEQYRIARQKPVESPSRPNPIPPSNIAQYGFGYTGQLPVPNNSPHRQSAKPRQQAQPSESSFRTGGWEAPAASSSTFGVSVEAGQPSHHLPWTGSTARHGGFTIDEDQEPCTFGMTPACCSSNDRRRHRGRSRRRKCARLQSTLRAQQASSYRPENWGNNPHQAPEQQPNCSNFSTTDGSFGQPMHGFVDRLTTTPRQQRAARRSLYSPDGWGNGPILQNAVQPVPAVANSTRPLDSGDHRAPRQSTTRNSPPRRQFSRSPAQCRGRSSSPRPDAMSRPKGEEFPFLVQLKIRKEAAERRVRERLDTERSQSTVNSIHSASPCSSRELFNCPVLMEGEAEERNSLAVNEAALANLQIREDPPGPSLTAAEAIALFIKYLADRHPEPVLHSELFELIFKRLTRFDEMDTFFQFVRSPHVLIGGGDPNRYSLASLEQTRKRLPQIKELTWAANRENVRQKLELIFSTSTTGIVSLQSITKFMQIASDELKRLPQCYPRLFRISSPGQLQIIRD